jgi:hypothetical protein
LTGRIAFNKSEGHFGLFMDIINQHTPGTYTTLDKAGEAIKEILRRIHEEINKDLREKKKLQN